MGMLYYKNAMLWEYYNIQNETITIWEYHSVIIFQYYNIIIKKYSKIPILWCSNKMRSQ